MQPAMPDTPAPRWLADCTDEQLRARFGAATFTRGAGYARDGAVTGVTVREQGRQLLAQVRGNSRFPYTVVINANGPRWTGRCSCPMTLDCKHVAAVLLTVRGASATAPRDTWEAPLAALLQAGTARAGTELALQVDASGGRVRLRPLRRGKGEQWVKTGASWRDLESPYVSVHAGQREALRALWSSWRVRQPTWSSPYADPCLALEELGTPGWRLLAEACEAGVALVDPSGRPTVTLAERPAELLGDLRHVGDAVLLRLAVDLPGVPSGTPVQLLGRPPAGLVVRDGESLLLAPFGRALDPATAGLLEASPLRVPAEDLSRFFRRYLPALRQRVDVGSADGSVTVPELEPPRLTLAVRFEPEHVTGLEWGFGYPMLGETVGVPLVGAVEDVVRDEPAEQSLLAGLAGLPQVRGVWDEHGRPVPTTELTGAATALFASALLPALLDRTDLEVTVIGEPAPYVESDAPPLISVATSDSVGDWFDLDVTVSVAGENVPMALLIAALAHGEEHLVLTSGTFFSLDRPELHALRRLVEEARELEDLERPGLRLTPLQAGLWEELVALGVVTAQSERWERTVRGLLDLTELPRPELPRKLQAELRPYQEDGYAWLSLLWDLGLGGILADDMGLGKTLQTLAMAVRAYEAGELEAPLLVVAPTSVVGAWAGEAERFCPDLPVVAITETERRSGVPVAERIAGAAVVITSYALLRLDEHAYLGQAWSGLVLDEAQHVKNSRAKTYSVARRLPAPFKLAITGTPLENSLMDLWSMLSITAPGLFPDPERFSEVWRRPIESGEAPEQLAALRRRIRPLMLRRTKEQVAADLPPKVEQVLEVSLGPAHRRIYDKQLQRERQRVLGLLDDLQRNRFVVLKSLTLLRQLSLDPALVDDRHAAVGSAKIDALVESLREVADEGHRALVFSSFTGFLARVRARLDAEGIGYCYLDGRTRDRPKRIEQFRTGDDPAFLISLKAGGTGLTLTEADYVFVLDPWWNPAVEAQAVDRAHRIGQTKSVNVYRLVSAGTIEEKVVALQQRKRELFRSVIDGDGAASSALTAEDIRALLT